MKKILLFSAAAMLAAGCAKEQADVNVKGGKTAGVVVTMTSAEGRANGNCDFLPAEWNPSRVALGSDGLTLNWEADDQIVIYEADAGGNAFLTTPEAFTVASGSAGSASGTFAGAAGFIKSGGLYRAYSPQALVTDGATPQITIPDDQTQPVTGSPAHLKNYIALASSVSAASADDAASFSIEALPTLLEIHITSSASTAVQVKSISITDNTSNLSFSTKLNCGISSGNATTAINYGTTNANQRNSVKLNVSDSPTLSATPATFWMVMRNRDAIPSDRGFSIDVEAMDGSIQHFQRAMPLWSGTNYGLTPGKRYIVNLDWIDPSQPVTAGEYKISWNFSTIALDDTRKANVCPIAGVSSAPEVAVTSNLQKKVANTNGALPGTLYYAWGGQFPSTGTWNSDLTVEDANSEGQYVFTEFVSTTNALTLKRIKANIRRNGSAAGKGLSVFYKIGVSGTWVNVLHVNNLSGVSSIGGSRIDIVLPTAVQVPAGEPVSVKFVQFWKESGTNAGLWFFNSSWADVNDAGTLKKGMGEALAIIGDVVPAT